MPRSCARASATPQAHRYAIGGQLLPLRELSLLVP
jgi:hypothetical protein